VRDQVQHRLEITGLVYGPHAIGRLDGKVLFVRGAAPGDVVDVTLREDHSNYAYADVHAVVRPGGVRRVPPCPYLPACGGCPWQHITYAAQLDAKERNLRDHLFRLGGLPDVDVRPILPSPDELGYRHRLSLRVAERRVGFYAGGTHELVSVERCLLASSEVSRAIASAGAFVAQACSDIRRIELIARGEVGGVVLVGEVHGPLAAADVQAIPAWLARQQLVAGAVLHGKGWRRAWGEERVQLVPEEGVTLSARAGTFTQVNPAANQQLVAAVVAAAQLRPSDRVLEFHAGVGNLTMPMARRVRQVIAVEQQALAAEDALANAARLGLTNCEIVTASARRVLRDLRRRRAAFDVIVLDPPRSGAAELVDELLALAAHRLVYVSCNPATLARDLRRLGVRYAVQSVQPLDMFPHSHHVEAVAAAVLTC
jgi:23S rRNA (uracil1939-C5)-methyltransferase